MRKSLQALLLSALVFPGAGHFSLKKPVQGVLLSAVSIVCFYFLLMTTVEIAQQLIVKIQLGEIPLDIETIREMVSRQLVGIDDKRINMPSIVFVGCWIVGIVDSFRIGWLQDKSDASANKQT